MINKKFVDKGLSNLPKLIYKKVVVDKTVIINKLNDKVSIKKDKDYKLKELKKSDKVILDFGNHEVGYLNLKLNYKGSHPDAPVLLRIHFAERPIELFEDRKSYNGWICSSWIEEEIRHVDVLPTILKIERRYAFRYCLIEILDISTKFSLIIDDAYCLAVSSANDNSLKEYKSSDKQLKQIDKVSCRTLHNCMQIVFEDGPKRDRRLWMGDLRIQALANYETYKNYKMVKACLYLFAGLPMKDGSIGACLFLEPKPEVDDTKLFDYSLFFINALLDYYKETKDLKTLKELWPTCLKQISNTKKQLDKNYLIKDSDVLGWCFTDWNLVLNKQASAQGMLLYSLLASIEIAHILKYKKIKELENLYSNCKAASNKYLFDSKSKYYLSGKDKQLSIASQVWLILGKAIEGKEAIDLLNRVNKDDKAIKMITPYMYHNYIDALILLNQKEKALKEIKKYWGSMVKEGADTFFELYNPNNPNESPYGGTIVNSYCHAWSCGPAYFLRKYFNK